MSRRGKLMKLADNIAYLYRTLRYGPPKPVEFESGPFAVHAHSPVATEEEIVPLMREPTPQEIDALYLDAAVQLQRQALQMSAHNQRNYESDAPWNLLDPWVGSTNENATTFGANNLEFTRVSGQNVQSIVASGTSGRTLRDPANASITFTITMTKKTTVNLNVMGNIPWWLQTTLNNFTQNGNFGIFSAVDQTLQLFSVPISKAAGATFTSVHNSPVTVGSFLVPPMRWCAVFSDGATVN